MAKGVPKIDEGEKPGLEPEPEGRAAEYAAVELRALDADAKAKEKLNREADQRYYLRWIAIVVVITIIGIMVLVLKHFAHHAIALKVLGAPAALLVAIIVSPIVSMSTLAIALLVAAFRGFKDGDEKAGIAVIAEGAKASGLGQ